MYLLVLSLVQNCTLCSIIFFYLVRKQGKFFESIGLKPSSYQTLVIQYSIFLSKSKKKKMIASSPPSYQIY